MEVRGKKKESRGRAKTIFTSVYIYTHTYGQEVTVLGAAPSAG